MPRLKSLTPTIEITFAGHAHGCRFNQKHRFAKGDPRFTIFPEKHHYCLLCAKTFIRKDIEKLQTLLTDVERAETERLST